MPLKRRRSSMGEATKLPIAKKTRISSPLDCFTVLSDELLIRILHKLPIQTLIQCQRVSHRFYRLAGDSQVWKNLYYMRFVLPRALRIPGIKSAPPEEALHFSSRRSKWLDDNSLVNRVDGKITNWKKQYKLRHNWAIGACEVQEIHVADRPSVPEMLVKLAEGVVLTVDKEDGLRAWDLKERKLIAKCDMDGDIIPTCLAIDEQESTSDGLGIAVGFENGGWGTWKLNIAKGKFDNVYSHPPSSNGTLSAVAFANPYILTITEPQLLSLYSFAPAPLEEPPEDSEEQKKSILSPQPRLLASLKSHTSWPPLSLSIRTTPTTLIASIAYSQPTYLSGYTIGLQELHLSLSTGLITFSRLASALAQGFSSLLSSPTGTTTPTSPPPHQPQTSNTRPTTLSYSHPYILATHPDNTLTLYLCTSTSSSLSITPGTKLWGHTSSVSSAEITPRGKAVSVSTRGNELRVWELEGGGQKGRRALKGSIANTGNSERSVRIRAEKGEGEEVDVYKEEVEASKRWVGFDDEVVIVLKESGRGTQALMVYDFT